VTSRHMQGKLRKMEESNPLHEGVNRLAIGARPMPAQLPNCREESTRSNGAGLFQTVALRRGIFRIAAHPGLSFNTRRN